MTFFYLFIIFFNKQSAATYTVKRLHGCIFYLLLFFEKEGERNFILHKRKYVKLQKKF